MRLRYACLLALLVSPAAAIVATPVYSNYLSFTGTLQPSTNDIQLYELIFYATDGVNSANGIGAVSGTCAAGNTCAFSSGPIGYNRPSLTAPTEVYYSILGFYGSSGVYGPQSGDVTGTAPSFLVNSNPDVFAVVNGASPDFDTFFPHTGSIAPAANYENEVASQFYNGRIQNADSIDNDVFANVPLISVGAPATLGSIEDFSNNLNGQVSIQASLVTPEPSGAIFSLAAFALLLAAARHRAA